MSNTDKVQCPNCGSFATLPMRDYSGVRIIGYVLAAMIFLYRPDEHPENPRVDKLATWQQPEAVGKFNSGQIKAFCRTCKFEFDVRTSLPKPKGPASAVGKDSSRSISTTERLGELERLHAANLISEEEYKSKRQEILRSL